MRLLTEAFVTVGTVEWPFIRVGSFVLGQCRFLLETAATNLHKIIMNNVAFNYLIDVPVGICVQSLTDTSFFPIFFLF